MNTENKRKGSDKLSKVDHRRHYVLVVDTETANTIADNNGKLDMSNVLVYDCGWQVVDTHGNVYAEKSYVNKDIFDHEKDLMQSAFYAAKIPRYLKDIETGARIKADTYTIRKEMLADMELYGIKEVAAHNARFDINALNGTYRYVTKSRFRYWFPYGTEIWDTMRMANSVICKMPTYKAFCEKHGYFTPTGRVKKTAEILWRFISGQNDFIESHTGLEDVQIESQIMAYCFKQHKAIEKELFKKKQDSPPPTTFQKMVAQSMRECPVLSGF